MARPTEIFGRSVGEPREPSKPRTFADDFFEKHPNAPRVNVFTPRCCVCSVYGDGVQPSVCSYTPCGQCWNRPLPDALTAQKGNDNA
jgi:hypothetical protein